MAKKTTIIFALLATIFACKKEAPKTNEDLSYENFEIEFAKGFSVQQNQGSKIIEVMNPWPGAEKSFRYLVVPKENLETHAYPKDDYDAVITTPISNIIVTSTTHIPALEALGDLEKLVGFPNTKYISSLPARKLIQDGKIRDLGQNESLNTEITLTLNPDVVIGFAINNENSNYEILQKANIPVVFNGDWVEQTPLGKAEWIKFFGLLLNKEKEADSIFNNIKESYSKVKSLASNAKSKPKVLSGALYKDVWYLPAGESWAAKFLADANAEYLYADTSGAGSLSLSLESVLEQAQQADIWISPSQFVSYADMEQSNSHYNEFKAFKDKNVFTFAATKGPTDGLLYYELAPQRPDLVLKDLVRILHPELLPNYSPYFFTPLQ